MINFEVKDCPVHLIMGSDSAREVANESADTLDRFGITYQALILSAHKTYEQLEGYTKIVRMKNLGLIAIAFANKPVFLASDLAARLPIPVIGVPTDEKFDGQNTAAGSMIDMPSGIGLTMVDINQGKNAALAAARMLAVGNPELREKMIAYQKEETQKVIDQNTEMQKLGFSAYMSEHPVFE